MLDVQTSTVELYRLKVFFVVKRNIAQGSLACVLIS